MALRASALLIGSLFLCSAPAAKAERLPYPLRFFEGATEMVSTVDLITREPYKARTIGQGKIQPDGSLVLVQRVEDEGKKPYQRRWHMKQVAPGRYVGTMSEARGPVTAEEVGDRFRFRFKLKGGVSVEQWIIPLAGGRAAHSLITIKKLGIKVGSSTGMITRSLR
ncbi:hypothetical protein [Sphingomonas daechungensis]|uniref:hypothetical protein n=1 Tax=Sphingomonas daechungensis TaxID=1176646 RepID=UPI0037845D19